MIIPKARGSITFISVFSKDFFFDAGTSSIGSSILFYEIVVSYYNYNKGKRRVLAIKYYLCACKYKHKYKYVSSKTKEILRATLPQRYGYSTPYR
jgi:hypothetical protein